jgi:short-subunit dehydrogenase
VEIQKTTLGKLAGSHHQGPPRSGKVDLPPSPVAEPAEVVTLSLSAPLPSPSSTEPTVKSAAILPLVTQATQNNSAPGVIAVLETPPPALDRDQKFLDKYGPWAVVTGASQGIGSEFAQALAEKGMNLVLVARSEGKLAAVAEQIRRDTGVQVQLVAADLSTPEGLEKVKQGTSELEVGLLVNNAGSWQFGSFLDNDVSKDLQSVALNVEAPMVLSHHFAGKMAQRGKGGVINVGSGAALHGVPGQAAYSATKGFLQNFTESLYAELKPKGVNVLITNPGPVQGEASSVYDQSKVPLQKVTGRKVADDALKRLGRGSTTIPGWINKIGINTALRLMPRDMMASIAGYILEQASDSAPAKSAPALQEGGPVAATTSVSTPSTTGSSQTPALLASGEAAAKNASGGVLGYLWGAVTAVTKPITSLFKTAKFAMGFVGDMRTRAEEITRDPDKVESQLKAAGLHHEYEPPLNKTNVKLQGKMVIKANMDEFFELWNSWISKGYGSINDRQYADLVLKFRDQARELPALAYMPMTSEDVFSAQVVDGRMTNMRETTTTKFAGVIPSSRVEWLYQRNGDPRASNSFEKTVDRFDGDLGKVQDFYNDLFDPRKVNPESKATVTFVVEEVDDLEKLAESQREFTHSVHVPMGGLLPKPESTLTR